MRIHLSFPYELTNVRGVKSYLQNKDISCLNNFFADAANIWLNETHFDMTKCEKHMPRNEITTCDSIVDYKYFGVKHFAWYWNFGISILFEALLTRMSFWWPTVKGRNAIHIHKPPGITLSICIFLTGMFSDVLIEISYFCYSIFISRAVSST